MIDSSPYKGIKHFRVNNTNLRIISEEEFQKLYEAASQDLKPILLMAVATGMRRGEILNLRWDDVNFKEGFILVRDSKNYESRTITIHPTLREALLNLREISKSEYVFGGRKRIDRAWENALRKAGIPHCRFHDLRHTFATRLVMKGADLVTVQELMGHKNINMTKRYSHPTPEYKKQAIERLNLGTMDTYMDTKPTPDVISEGMVTPLSSSNQRRI